MQIYGIRSYARSSDFEYIFSRLKISIILMNLEKSRFSINIVFSPSNRSRRVSSSPSPNKSSCPVSGSGRQLHHCEWSKSSYWTVPHRDDHCSASMSKTPEEGLTFIHSFFWLFFPSRFCTYRKTPRQCWAMCCLSTNIWGMDLLLWLLSLTLNLRWDLFLAE